MFTGLLLMLNSGLQIGWGIWRLGFIGFWSWSLGVHIFVTMAWSVGAFFGGFIGAVLTPILKKNAIYVSFKHRPVARYMLECFIIRWHLPPLGKCSGYGSV